MKFKNDMVSLDATDFQILRELQKDSRATYGAIGEMLGIAHSTVYDRVKRMEQEKVIKNYTTIVDAEKIGVKSTVAIMTVYTDPKETEKVAERLAALPEVLEVYTSLSEELLIIAKVTAFSQEGLHELIANSIAPFPGVLRIRTSVITKKFKEAKYQVLGEKKS